MFDVSLCPANDLRQATEAFRQLIKCRLEQLRRIGVDERDIKLIFPSGHCHPDWCLVDDILDEDAKQLVREIFADAHDVARAEDELELRARAN
jgi:hypothetical protein